MKKLLIIITGMVNEFNNSVASLLCEKLAMYMLDFSKLMEFELADKDEIIAKCGVEYLENLENKLVKSVVKYENTVIVVNYDLLTYKNNYENFMSSGYSFYLRFEKDKIKNNKNVNIINKIAFQERDAVLKNVCEHVLTLKSLNPEHALNRILEQLKEVELWIWLKNQLIIFKQFHQKW